KREMGKWDLTPTSLFASSPFLPSPAFTAFSYRTAPTLRHFRGAHNCSQLHDGLIECPGRFALAWNQQRGRVPYAAIHPAPAVPGVKRAADHPGDVGIHGGRGALVGKARHGSSGVPADSREFDQLRRISRDHAVASLHDFAGQLMEIGGTPIVAQ